MGQKSVESEVILLHKRKRVCWLYFSIKEKENTLNMGVMVFKHSEEGPSWNICLPSLLHCHSFACNFTSFKGVTSF